MKKLSTAIICLILGCGVLFSFNASASTQALQRLKKMPNASLFVEGDPRYNLRANKSRTPASTLKILTALLALNAWKPDYRFITDFYIDKAQVLWIKGYGDPYLTSEELDKIIVQLKKKGLRKINGIGVDSSFFADNLYIDGRSRSNNPYDAPASALSVNFNTLNFIKNKHGIHSAEKQTPTTPLMTAFGQRYAWGSYQINLGQQALCPQHFAEVLSIKLRQQGIKVTGKIIKGRISTLNTPFYRHYNSHKLTEVLSAMLKYSNNFIANQLFLLLGAKHFAAPATIEKSRLAFSAKVKALFGWNKVFYEGSGLSRKNTLTATELVAVLKKFAPYRHLLKKQNSRIFAKTGTLRGVSSYAGYLYKAKKWVPFALLINRSMNGSFRKKVAKELLLH